MNFTKRVGLNRDSSMSLLFKYLALLLIHCLVTSRCMKFIFGDKREATCLIRESLPVTEKEGKGEGNMPCASIFHPRADALPMQSHTTGILHLIAQIRPCLHSIKSSLL